MPSALKIVYNNAADRGTITAGSAAIPATNLQTDSKSEVWRSVAGWTGTTLSATFPSLEPVACVALPFCNFSQSAQMRVRVSKEKSATNLQPQSETSGGWVAAGSTPPGVTPVPEINGVSAVRIDFLPGMSGGYAGCRAGRTQASYRFPIQAGVSYANSLFVMLSRPLTGSESVQIFCTGTYGGLEAGINQLNSSTYVGSFSRVLLPASVMGLSGTNAFVIYLSGPVNSPLSVFLTRMQAEVDKHTSYYPTTTTAATRPAGYIDSWQSYDYDSGWVLACEGAPLQLYGMTPAQAASAYSYGGGSCARHWLPNTLQAYGVSIQISDDNNLQGYLEAARLVIGDCFTTQYNAEYGAEITFEDRTENHRTDAGNLVSDVGCRYKVLKADLSILSPTERSNMWKLVGYVGKSVPVFASLMTGTDDKDAELAYTVYGKFTEMSTVSAKNFMIYSAPLEIESV